MSQEIRIQSLGRFGVVASGQEHRDVRRQPVRSALLVYLAMEREATRDRILGVFWPERPDVQARHALSQTLHKLHRDLHTEWVRAEGEALVAADTLEIDARAFERAVQCGEHGAALALYGGPFLDGWRLHDTREFELWVEEQRARLSRLFAVASREHIRECERVADLEDALATARRWTALAPRDDSAHAVLVALLARSGARSEAERHYADFRRSLAAEGLEPAREVAEQVERTLSQAAPPSSAPTRSVDCVLVLPFENLTAREDLDPLGRMAADWITEGLDRTGMVTVIPALEGPRTMGATASSSAAHPLTLAREGHAGTLVRGSYYVVDAELELRAQVIDVGSGELRGTVEPVRLPLEGADRGVALLRERVLGLLAAALEKDWSGLPSPPELGLRPPTYEAYRAYARAVEHFLKEEFGPALCDLEQAIALDPGFTRAILMAAAVHGNLGQWDRAEPLVEALEAVSDRLSPYEAAALRWHRARLAGDREEAYATHTLAWRRYPGTVAHFVAGLSALEVNRPGVAITVYRSLDPDRGWVRQFHRYWDALTAAHHMAGDHEGELEAARRARSRFPSLLSALASEVRALAALGRVAALDELRDTARDLPPQYGWSYGKVLMTAVEELRAHDRPDAAGEWGDRAVDWFRGRTTAGPFGAPGRSELAASLYAARRWDEAEVLFRRLTAEFPRNLDYQGRLGVLAARLGREHAAERAERRLESLRMPYLFGRNTLWRARIAAQLGQADRSVELLRRAFGGGLPFGLELHADPDFEPLRGLAEFREILRPKA